MSSFYLGRIVQSLAALTMLSASMPAADYFPLQPGNTWMYRNNATAAAFTVRVSTPAVIGGKVYYALQGYVGSTVMARLNEFNTLVFIDNDTNQERPLVGFTPMMAGWLDAPYRPCEQESQTQERRNAYSGPAGEFRDVLAVRFRSLNCADAGTQLEQFAENIGMLRRVDSSFAGPVQYDLVYARIGATVVNALPNGSLNVTLDQVNNSNTLTAVLRLHLHNTAPMKLHFPTSQEFDAVLVDESGNVVWKWSEGKFFTQALHDKDVSVEWTIPIQFQRPGTPSQAPQPKNYTLQAWLTTIGPAPQFAASVPVTIATPLQ